MCDHCGCRAYGPIAELSDEHETILELAWSLAAGTAAPGDVDQLVALLDRHVVKEEAGLYPSLGVGGDLDEDRLARLEDEHVEVRARLTGGGFDRRAYYALAAHIEEEETELFPAAMFAFDDDTWHELGHLFADADAAATEAAPALAAG